MSIDAPLAPHSGVAPGDRLLDRREDLRDREEQLSYWRRVVQGRLDILQARLDGSTAALSDVLGGTPGSATRLAHSELRPMPPMLELATADRAWDLAVSSDDVALLTGAVARLSVAERWLSAQRTSVLRDLNGTVEELSTWVSSDPLDYLDTVGRRLPHA